MNGFLLDTNVPSELIRPAPDPRVRAWVSEQAGLFLSAVSFGELRKGIYLREPGKRQIELEAWLENEVTTLFAGRILPLTRSIAERWGVLEGMRERMGRRVSFPDAQIAATALEHGLTLVTRNVRDFERLGLDVLNPWEA